MEKSQIAQTVLLNKFVLTLLIFVLMIALSSSLGIAELNQGPPTPF